MLINDLREYIFPLFVVHSPSEGTIDLESRKLLGTGFFISNKGDALTAAHVIPSPDSLDAGYKIIAFPVIDGKPIVCWVNKALCFPKEDVALFEVNIKDSKFLFVSNERIYAGTDIATIGYPSHSINHSGLEARVLKGHVTLSHNKIELNFPIPAGMSGSPVIYKDKVIAVSTGRVKSEELIDSFEELAITENQKESIRIIETKNVIYYGLAMPLNGLADRKEAQLNNRSLMEFIEDQN